MAYSITYSSGVIPIFDGTMNTSSTSLSLPGRQYSGYGGPTNQNFVYLLENFASWTSGPNNPIKGQVWFDSSNATLKYNIGVLGAPNWVGIAPLNGSPTFTNVTANGNLTVTGNARTEGVNSASFVSADFTHTYGINNNVLAAGTSQNTATPLNKDISVITAIVLGQGVSLPVTTGGLRFTVINATNTSLLVYPNIGAKINVQAIGLPYTVAAYTRLEFISVSNIQWYTLNSTSE
jgi:hypothetical protein